MRLLARLVRSSVCVCDVFSPGGCKILMSTSLSGLENLITKSDWLAAMSLAPVPFPFPFSVRLSDSSLTPGHSWSAQMPNCCGFWSFFCFCCCSWRHKSQHYFFLLFFRAQLKSRTETETWLAADLAQAFIIILMSGQTILRAQQQVN